MFNECGLWVSFRKQNGEKTQFYDPQTQFYDPLLSTNSVSIVVPNMPLLCPFPCLEAAFINKITNILICPILHI